jgi:hypothetical protein
LDFLTSKSESYNADIMLPLAAYCVVAVESVGQQMPIAFLVRIKDDFSKRYGGGKAATAAASSLNREFGYVLLPVWGLLEYMAFYFANFVYEYLLHVDQNLKNTCSTV